MVKIPKGEHFIKRGEKMNSLYMVTQGTIKYISAQDEIIVGSGTIIGIMECWTGVYRGDYISQEDCIVYPLPYSGTNDLKKIFKSQPAYVSAFFVTSVKEASMLLARYVKYYKRAQNYYNTAAKLYQQYQELCNRYGITVQPARRIEAMEPLALTDKIDSWEVEFYYKLNQQNSKEIMAACGENTDIVIGYLMYAGRIMAYAVRDIDEIFEYLKYNAEVCLNSRHTDLLQLFLDLAEKCARRGIDVSEITARVKVLYECCKQMKLYEADMLEVRFTEYFEHDFTKDRIAASTEDDLETDEEAAEDCFLHIMEYAGLPEEEILAFRSKLQEYQNIPDNLDLDETARKMRRDLSRIFYTVYKKVFKRAVTEKKELTPILKMFLNFGFVDVGIVGEENANELYDLTDRLFLCKSEHVYTVYEWLKSIYMGKNEPCRNEFDLDYNGYLAEQKRIGRMDIQQMEACRDDNWKKVEFEMENMFQSTNRATYGRISMFCPILSGKDMLQSAEKMLVTVKKLEEALEYVRSIDYSLFYHDVVFSDPAHEVNREMLKKEVLPDIILMPNVGTRPMMWQETAGIKRDTSARFVLPVMTTTSVTDMIVETCGRYRWEICRKIQGMRWNDITEKSLTSEYSDYIQYYRKNHDLSGDAREKIKNALWKAKNNFREVFVSDYVNWIKYESSGSYRLNKVSRDILFRYCPFAKEYRDKLEINPMYQDMISRFKILTARQLKRIRGFNDKYEKNGGEITIELKENEAYYNL